MSAADRPGTDAARRNVRGNVRRLLRLPGLAVRLLPALPGVNADCDALAAAYTGTVAPLLPEGGDPRLADRLLPWAVQGGLLLVRHARLTGHTVDPATAVLAGAFTRLYDDALDEHAGPSAADLVNDWLAAPAAADAPLPGPAPGPGAARAAASLFRALRARTDPDRHRTAYAALPALHAAQLASVRLTANGRDAAGRADAAALLDASRTKGGLGMLVLGGLVQHAPSAAQREALLALGAFLQLVDDYQDRAVDLRAGVMTAATLDALPLRLLHEELDALDRRLTSLYGPRRARPFVDGLTCWLYLTALARLVGRGAVPAPERPVRPPSVPTLFARREVIR